MFFPPSKAKAHVLITPEEKIDPAAEAKIIGLMISSEGASAFVPNVLTGRRESRKDRDGPRER
jgi:hypothetical protein